MLIKTPEMLLKRPFLPSLIEVFADLPDQRRVGSPPYWSHYSVGFLPDLLLPYAC